MSNELNQVAVLWFVKLKGWISQWLMWVWVQVCHLRYATPQRGWRQKRRRRRRRRRRIATPSECESSLRPQCTAAAGANQRLCYHKYFKLISWPRTVYFYITRLYPCRQYRAVSKCAECSTTVTKQYIWSIIFCNIYSTFPQLKHRITTIRKVYVWKLALTFFLAQMNKARYLPSGVWFEAILETLASL